ncbi:GGDEF domain-containing protein [Vibrio sp. L3-7]|uniref:GGDEF domain-containing protein n=1 Tax=Vibrio sp. L3-7 TaxID=2912253 RepID=UPI001F3075A6|nr:GGDEF domain-containing protein [Vibrio sp. L3-7]MCF7506958.1 GGDEF domain-containing protein [Vibrio sp. L3-7]
MDNFPLDIRTLSIIFIIFSLIFSIGLLLFQSAQKQVLGLSLFSTSMFVIGSGTILLSLRGVIPDFISIIVANLTIAYGFHLVLHSLTIFRRHPRHIVQYSRIALFLVLVSFVQFTYYDQSIQNRIIVMSLYLAFVTASSAIVILNGKKNDLALAVNMMALPFIIYSLFMTFRAIKTNFALNDINSLISSNYLNEYTYILSIILIVSMSFSMLWLINARLVHSLQCISQQDPLTTLKNRRALDLAVKKHQAQVNYKSVCIVLLDIDNFKQVNDQFGHLVGDDAIKALAKTVLKLIDLPNTVFRLGGDEILIWLPNSNLERAAALSEKLRSAIQKIKLEQQPTLTITSSFGISLLSENEKWKDCVDRADRALYQAKLKGRNTIVIEESYDSYSTSTKAIGSS